MSKLADLTACVENPSYRETAKIINIAQHRCYKNINLAIQNLQLGLRTFDYYKPIFMIEQNKSQEALSIQMTQSPYSDIQKVLDPLNEPVMTPEFKEFLNEKRSNEYIQGLYKAALIMAHSAFDDMVSDYIKALFTLNPEMVIDLYPDREVKFTNKEIHSEKFSTLLETKKQDTLKKSLNEIKNASLPKRIDTLFKFSKAERTLSNLNIYDGYTYKAKTIKDFDQLRHDVIHNDKNIPDDYDVLANLKYLQDTTIAFYKGFIIEPFKLPEDIILSVLIKSNIDLRNQKSPAVQSDSSC